MTYNINDFKQTKIDGFECWTTEQVCKLTNITDDELNEFLNYRFNNLEVPWTHIEKKEDKITYFWRENGLRYLMKYFMEGAYIDKYTWVVYYDIFDDMPDTFTD